MKPILMLTVFGLSQWVVKQTLTNDDAAVWSLDPRENIWVTWAKSTNQPDFCLSLAQANDPFRTCLIGYPYFQWQDWQNYTLAKKYDIWNDTSIFLQQINNKTCVQNLTSVRNAYELFQVVSNLTVNATLPLQELDLMGSFSPYGPLVNFTEKHNCSTSHSLGAENGTGAVLFNIRNAFDNPAFWNLKQKVGASETGQWKNASLTFGTAEVTTLGNYQFPPGYFLICGDRAWPGIPENPWGGPCYIGKLTMFTPSYRYLLHNAYNRTKREVKGIGPDCDPHVQISSLGAAVSMAFFAPGLIGAENWRNIKRLACFAIQEFNITSNILDDLLHDVDSIRHAVLQNRAAIDFLLLAQGHGCHEFEGMCCLNLSDHSDGIHAQIQKLRDKFKDVTVANSWLDKWLTSCGITGWLLDLVKHVIIIALVVFLVLLLLPCFLQCVQWQISKVMKAAGSALVVIKKERGSVESLARDWLCDQGHEASEILELIRTADGKVQRNKMKVSW